MSLNAKYVYNATITNGMVNTSCRFDIDVIQERERREKAREKLKQEDEFISIDVTASITVYSTSQRVEWYRRVHAVK